MMSLLYTPAGLLLSLSVPVSFKKDLITVRYRDTSPRLVGLSSFM